VSHGSILIISDASHVTSFIDNTKLCHPVYAVAGSTTLLIRTDWPNRCQGNLGIYANLAENRETIALLPIFDEKRHPGRTEEQMDLAKKNLFLQCMQAGHLVVLHYKHTVD
jgi:hypothetical protein